MPLEDRRPWTVLINASDVIVRAQEPAPAPPDPFEVTFEVIDVRAETVTQFTITPEQWFDFRSTIDDIIHKRLT